MFSVMVMMFTIANESKLEQGPDAKCDIEGFAFILYVYIPWSETWGLCVWVSDNNNVIPSFPASLLCCNTMQWSTVPHRSLIAE